MKHIFFDIDGTLLSFDNRIPDSTVYALSKLKENGHKIYLCTGRTKGYVREKQLQNIGFDGGVYGCGTMIEMNGETNYLYSINKDVLDMLHPFVKSPDIYCVFEGKEYLYMKYEKALYKKGEIEHVKNKIGYQFDFANKLKRELNEYLLDVEDYYKEMDVSKFSFFSDNYELRDKLFDSCKDLFYPISHTSSIHEMVPCGHSKGDGIRKLISYANGNMEDTISFGDSVNDLKMFESTSISICMGSGSDIAKKNASMVTSDFETGIYDACKKLNLI